MSDEQAAYVIFSALYLPSMGGVQNYTANLARALASMGKRVIVVTSQLGSDPWRETADGVVVVRLPSWNLLGGRLPVSRKNAAYRRLLSELEDESVAGVIVNTRFYRHSLEGLQFARKKGLSPILIEHGSAHLTLGNALADKAIEAYEHMITRRVKQFQPRCFAVSRKGGDWLGHFGIESQGVLSNSIDAGSFRGLSSGRDFRSEIGVRAEDFLVAFVGRLTPEKGVESLLKAAQMLIEADADGGAACRQHPRVVFAVAGDGPLRPSVETCGLDNVVSVGRLAASDVSALLSQADAFCLPSRSEGFATALLECAAWGVPVVVTNVGGVDELVLDDSYGIVLRSADSATVAGALEALAADRDHAASMGRNMRDLVEAEYSWHSVAAKVVDLVEETAGEEDGE
ncbi:glycosyltransferase family 4 protein [Xiamenia xianingshaonis]|uniref:glycosyltransferase family 4 protein n=1 Tax=Xiamenia xianingshaonis TaxID=2682776 RepID=UPI00140B27F9|nr:glycosyltransferase family 4 protein [Xiamenia xianingshaonis]